MTREPAVEAADVSRIYTGAGEPVHALQDLSLTLESGSMTALVGPSGCGKSTLLGLIGCIDVPTSGTVRIGGVATGELSDDALTALRRDRVGTVFQGFHLIGALTLLENVALPLLLAGVDAKRAFAEAQAGLANVGIGDRGEALPSRVSGGQQQRAAIARAVVRRPTVVLADEPTGSLDTENGQRVMELLRGLADGGQTILVATHSQEAAAYCDGVASMRDGRLVSRT